VNYVLEMTSSVMIHIPTLIKIGSDIQKLIRGEFTDTRTHRQHGDRISLLKKLGSKPESLDDNSIFVLRVEQHSPF
jgi:hypothetical protein